jgi:hypothetical protein
MPPQEQFPPSARAIDNALSASVRLLQRKLPGWTDSRWANAIAEVTDGSFAPAWYRLKDTLEWSGPVPYIETSIHKAQGLILSRQGLYRVLRSPNDAYEWSVADTWTTQIETAADVTQLQSLAGFESISTENILRLEPSTAPPPVVQREGTSVRRFPIQDWNLCVNFPQLIPDFPDLSSMLSWLERSLSEIPNIHGPSFFGTLAVTPTLSKWLSGSDDWKILTQYIRPKSFADLDVSPLPRIEDPWFFRWLEAASGPYENVRTLLERYQTGVAPGNDAGRLVWDAYSSWVSDNVDVLTKQELKIPARVLAVFCTMYTPQEATRRWLQKTLHSRQHEAEPDALIDMAAAISHDLVNKMSPAWIDLLAASIDRHNIEKKVATLVHHRWRQQLLISTGNGDLSALPAYKFFVIFEQTLKDTALATRGNFFCAVLESRGPIRSTNAETAFVASIRTVFTAVWPEKQSYFDTISGLEQDFRLWPALLRGELAETTTHAALPELDTAP